MDVFTRPFLGAFFRRIGGGTLGEGGRGGGEEERAEAKGREGEVMEKEGEVMEKEEEEEEEEGGGEEGGGGVPPMVTLLQMVPGVMYERTTSPDIWGERGREGEKERRKINLS